MARRRKQVYLVTIKNAAVCAPPNVTVYGGAGRAGYHIAREAEEHGRVWPKMLSDLQIAGRLREGRPYDVECPDGTIIDAKPMEIR